MMIDQGREPQIKLLLLLLLRARNGTVRTRHRLDTQEQRPRVFNLHEEALENGYTRRPHMTTTTYNYLMYCRGGDIKAVVCVVDITGALSVRRHWWCAW